MVPLYAKHTNQSTMHNWEAQIQRATGALLFAATEMAEAHEASDRESACTKHNWPLVAMSSYSFETCLSRSLKQLWLTKLLASTVPVPCYSPVGSERQAKG